MHPLPHRYSVRAAGEPEGSVAISSAGLPVLQTSAPPEFGGPEGHWSPETLLAAAVADCFILSFRAVARASKLAWRDLDVDVAATLDRVEGVTRFTRFSLAVRLVIEDAAAEGLAQAALAKAKRACLVTNSLSAECELQPTVQVVAEAG